MSECNFIKLLDRIDSVALNDLLWMLSQNDCRHNENICKKVIKKIRWKELANDEKKFLAVKKAKNWRFTNEVIKRVNWGKKTIRQLLKAIKISGDTRIATKCIKTNKLNAEQIVLAIESLIHDKYYDDHAIYAAIESGVLCFSHMIRVVRLSRHKAFVSQFAYENFALNIGDAELYVMRSMLLIETERKIRARSIIAQDIITKNEWQSLSFSKAIIALKLSNYDLTIAKDIAERKIDWKKITKKEAIEICEKCRYSRYIILAVIENNLICLEEIKKMMRDNPYLVWWDIYSWTVSQLVKKQKFGKKEIVKQIREHKDYNLAMSIIQSNVLSGRQMLNICKIIEKEEGRGDDLLEELIEKKQLSPELILEGLRYFRSKESIKKWIARKSIEKGDLSFEQMLKVLRLSDNNSDVSEAISKKL